MEKGKDGQSYQEYIEDIINVFRLSKKEKSIMFALTIEKDEALIKLFILNSDGTKESLQDVRLSCKEGFYDQFLKELVQRVQSSVPIVSKDIVNLDEDDLVTLRFITENNDLLTFDGLSQKDAEYLLKLSTSVSQLEFNSQGIVEIGMLLFMISVLTISFIATVTLIG